MAYRAVNPTLLAGGGPCCRRLTDGNDDDSDDNDGDDNDGDDKFSYGQHTISIT